MKGAVAERWVQESEFTATDVPIQNKENQIEFYNAMLKFLDKHLNGAGRGR